MPWRPYPTDTPDRGTDWRRGIVRALVAESGTGYHYLVDFSPLGTEMAFSRRLLDVNDTAHCQWRDESGIWWIT